MLFVLDTVTVTPSQASQTTTATISGAASSEGAKALVEIVIGNLLFLRNSSFTRSSKLHFLSNNTFLPCLLAFLTNQQQLSSVKAQAAACLWVILFNHQGVKAALNREEVISELQLLRQES